jgi:hypothetical protein
MLDIHMAYGTSEWLDVDCEVAFLLDIAREFHTKRELFAEID